jgi:hypothetical protein
MLKFIILLLSLCGLAFSLPYLGNSLGNNKISRRATLLKTAPLWPGGVLPYTIDRASYMDNSTIIGQIESAIRHMQNQLSGCITLVPRTTELTFLILQDNKQGTSIEMSWLRLWTFRCRFFFKLLID